MDDRFIVKSDKSIVALKYWLKKREYNCYSMSSDKNGNIYFALTVDSDPDGDWGKTLSREGFILLLDNEKREQAENLIDRRMQK